MQRNESSIADVLPLLLSSLNTLKQLIEKTSSNGRKIIYLLISSIKNRFEYEFNSKLYQMSSLLKISKLNSWLNKSFKKDLFDNSLKSLSQVYFDFIYKDKSIEVEEKGPVKQNEVPNSAKSDDIMIDFFTDSEDEEIEILSQDQKKF